MMMADGADQNKLDKVDRSLKPASIARIVELAQKHCTAAEWGELLRIPLKHAAGGGDKELTEELVRVGASGDPISEAIRGGQHRVIKHLDRRPNDDQFRLAVQLGDEAMVSLLLKLGADVEPMRFRFDIDRPLLVAAKAGHAGVVGLLLDAGVDASLRATQDELIGEYWGSVTYEVETVSALDLAAGEGHVDVIKKITQREPSLVNSVSDSTRFTALHYAAKHSQIGSIDALVEAGADLEAGLIYKVGTALHVAVESPDCEATLLALLRNGAHVDSRRSGNVTPLCVAAGTRNRVAADTLVSAGADLNIALLAASTIRVPREAVLMLLRRGADVHTRQKSDGNTPLHLAAMATSSHLVDVLLKVGGDETAANRRGETPLDVIGRGDSWYWVGGRKAVRSLLVNAPRDKAWYRRRFFVMCRAFPDRVRLELVLPGDRDMEGRSSMNSTSEGPSANGSKRPKSREQACDDEQCFRTAMGRLMAVEADIVFRTIVEFL